jgi:phospholipid/cholesterol/gamma-HCH transport system substrate-binding protein
MSRFIKPLTTVVVLLFIAGGAGLYYTQNSKKDDTYQVTAYFSRAIGLFPRSDVDVLGVAVGKISDVQPVGTRVKVTMEIEKKYKIPADATAEIIPPSLISDRFVQFEPAYTGGPTLEDGAVLEVAQTAVPAELDDTFKQLKKLLEAIEPGQEGEPGALGALIVELDKALDGQEQNLKGTLINASRLTHTLAGAKGHLSGLLVNLDSLFSKLATRAGSYGTLNRNFALVLKALEESRGDLTGALSNLADMTNEVGSLVRDHRAQLGNDLGLAAKVLQRVLANRASVAESLKWLPVLGEGARNAYNPPHQDIDVRDNATAKIKCDAVDDLPDSPLKDILKQICEDITGGGGGPLPIPTPAPAASPGTLAAPPTIELPNLKLNCKKGVKEVRHQVKKLEDAGLPDEVRDEITKPLRKKLKKLGKKCKKLGDAIGGGLLDNLPDVGDVPRIKPSSGTLRGNAAGTSAAPASDSETPVQGLGRWVDGFLGFLGFGS